MTFRLIASHKLIWLAGLCLSVVLIQGCAYNSPAQPRSISVAPSPERAMTATLEVLLERGFVIRHADADLHQIEAVMAAGANYSVSATISETVPASGAPAIQSGNTYITLSGRQAGRPLDALALDPLFIDIQKRLGLLF